MVEKRQVLKLNANNIQLHEEAIKAFQNKQEEDEDCKAIHVQHLNDFRSSCRQSAKERSWVNEKRRLDSLEATTLKQIRKQRESLSKVLSNTDMDCISLGGDDYMYSCTGMKSDIVHVLTSFRDFSQQQEAAPSIVANRLIQAREEMVSVGEGLKEMRETASRELSRALLDVTESLRAVYVDEKGELFPDEVKAKIESLKKKIVVAGAIEDDAATAAVMSLEADLHERFTAVYARYEQRIVVGGSANNNNLSEATMVLNRQIQQATKWAMKRVDEAIDCESSRQQQAALTVVQKALTEESHSRLKQLREARENVAKSERQRISSEKIDEEARQLELNAFQVNERQQIKVGIEQWKEMQRKDEESKQSKAAQQQYQDELDRLNRMNVNGKRVSYRETKLTEKLYDKQRQLEEAARAEERKFEKLSQLAATTPYYDSIADVQSNIHGTTACRENDVFQGDTTGLASFQHGLSTGFSDEKIFSNRLFRLGHALREAGASNTVAARDAVRREIPRQKAIWEHCS